MSRSNVVLGSIAFAACFALLAVLTSRPLQPLQASPKMHLPRFAEVTANGTTVSAGLVPRPQGALVAHFSSHADALAAAALVKEALKWADPKVRVSAPTR